MGSNRKETCCEGAVSMCSSHVLRCIALDGLLSAQDKISHSSVFPLENIFFELQVPLRLKLPFADLAMQYPASVHLHCLLVMPSVFRRYRKCCRSVLPYRHVADRGEIARSLGKSFYAYCCWKNSENYTTPIREMEKYIQFYQKCIRFSLKNFLLSPEVEIIWSKAKHCEHEYYRGAILSSS